jgi:hypothetical protein
VNKLVAITDIKKAHCANCGDTRNCSIEAKVEERGGDEDFQWHTDWFTLKCRGCDDVFVQKVGTNSEDYENYYEPDGSAGTAYNETISYWPAISERKPPEWLKEYSLSFKNDSLLDRIFVEIYGALNSGIPMLAATGIRTAFDVAAVELGADEREPFASKIETLVSSEKINATDKARLTQLIEAGSASAHRGWTPTAQQLTSMMDILEHFIEASIVATKRRERLDAMAKALSSDVPPRKK